MKIKFDKIVKAESIAFTIFLLIFRPISVRMNVPYIAELLNRRLPKYLEAADITVAVDGKDAEQIIREILEKLG